MYEHKCEAAEKRLLEVANVIRSVGNSAFAKWMGALRAGVVARNAKLESMTGDAELLNEPEDIDLAALKVRSVVVHSDHLLAAGASVAVEESLGCGASG